jgi:hypothetical protein
LLVDVGDAGAPPILAGLVYSFGLTFAMGAFGFLGFVGAGLMFKYIPVYAVKKTSDR